MRKHSKPIRLSCHAKERLPQRGTTDKEITETINSAKWSQSELGRMECSKDFTYDNIWNDKHYKIKRVKPIFANEEKEIVVVTVYVYYF